MISSVFISDLNHKSLLRRFFLTSARVTLSLMRDLTVSTPVPFILFQQRGHCVVAKLHTYSRSERGLHVLTFTGIREGGQPLVPVTGETQQVDDLQQVGGHHGDAQVEEAVAEADRALQAAQGLGAHPTRLLSLGTRRGGGGGGGRRGR